MAPAAGVLPPVRDHDVLLGELPSLSVGFGNDQIASQGPFGDGLGAPGGLPVLEEALLAGEQALEIGGRPGDPVVGQRGRPSEGDVAPAADPEGRVRSGQGLRLEPTVDRVVCALEAHPLLGPEGLHDRQLLLEPGAALLQLDAVERELVRLVPNRDAERDAPAGHHVEHRDVLGEAYGMVEGGDDDVGAEHHPRRARREAGEHRERRRPVVIRHRVVLLHPYGVEAELFRSGDFVERLPVVLAAFDGDKPDLEPGHIASLGGARA